MRSRKRLGSSLGQTTITELNDMFVIKQKRPHQDSSGGRYLVTLTRAEARAVAENITKRLALHEELDRRGLT